MTDHDPVPRTTPDLNAERLEQLQELFPEAFTEGQVDFDKLRTALGDQVDDRPERYSFTWAGKSEALRLLQTPTSATLVPDRDESVNFDETNNLFIEADNLEALKLLYKSYFGRVKMIYIDPPYNTGNDFIYPDDYTDPLETYLQLTGQRDAEGNLLSTNAETNGRYHSAWLSMMYPRLWLARQLLREDGVIFVSIDDNEVHNLRMLMNEVFGEENFVATVCWQKRTAPDARATLGAAHDYILVYARQLDPLKAAVRMLPLTEERETQYVNPDSDPRGAWASRDITGQTGHAVPSQYYEITTPGGAVYAPPEGRCWAISRPSFARLVSEGRIWFGKDGTSRPRMKLYLSEAQGMASWTWWSNKDVGHNQEATKELNALLGASDVFNNPKPVRLIARMLRLTTGPSTEDTVLDFFGGSCTTAQAVVQLNREDGGNRRFILVQLPEPTVSDDFPTIADIGKERIRRVIARLQQEDQTRLDISDGDQPEDLGFRVYKLAPSNLRPWASPEAGDTEAVSAQLQRQLEPLREGWTEESVVAEVALKEGLGLTFRTETLAEIPGNSVRRVTDGDRQQSFLICLDDRIAEGTWQALKLEKDDLFVCRDSALSDTMAANLALQCRLHTI